MTRIYWADTAPLYNDDVYEKCLGCLFEHTLKKVNRIKNRDDKNLSAASGVLLNEALKGFPNYSGNETYATDKKGKPYFLDNQKVHFSLSHSGNIAICAVSDTVLGIDIQKIQDFNENICHRFFRKNEKDYVLNAPCENRKNNFFRIWTLKEAYAKMTGCGISSFKDFELKFLPDGEITDINNKVCFTEFDINGYKTSLCTTKKVKDFEFKKINLLNLIIN